MPAVTYAEPTTTRTPLHFDVLPPVKQSAAATTIPIAPAPLTPTQSRPIDYHAEPKNIPDIQQKIKNNDSIIPSASSRGFSVYQDPTLPQGVTQADVEGTASVGKFFLGVGDQLSGQNTIKNDNYQVRADQRRYVFTPLENFAYDIGRRAADGAQSGLSDLWEHRPQFEIPTIKIPKFERPGLPDIFKPKPSQPQPKPQEKPIPGQPKPTVEEPTEKPQPGTKERDIPRLTEPKPKADPPPAPGKRRYKLPATCECNAIVVFAMTIYDSEGMKPGVPYFAKWRFNNSYKRPDDYIFVGSSIGNSSNGSSAFYAPGFAFSSLVEGIAGNIPTIVFAMKQITASEQEGGYVDLVMPKFYPNTLPDYRTPNFDAILASAESRSIDWEFLSISCLGCDAKPTPIPKEDPPPDPPEDCDCMAKCCPDLDYRKIQKIIEEEVKKLDVTAAIPLSFQIRHEGDTPQMVIQCAERKSAASGNTAAKYDSAKYPITVPHWKGGQNDKPSLPPYKKGNWEGILVLKDNSKVTINAQNESECTKILNAIKPWIDSKMLEDSYFKGGKITTKRPIKETQVYPQYGRYFAKGQKNNKPDWRVDFP